MNLKQLCITALFILVFAPAFADSPLTSTFFATYYYEYPIIEKTAINPVFNEEVAAFLFDKKNPVDAKAALVNAIGWSYDGTRNAELFKEKLAAKYKKTTARLQMNDLKADELMCLGYFMAFDDYFDATNLQEASNVLELAKKKSPGSFTINMIHALIQSQLAMDTDYCKVWELVADVLNNKSLKRDMKRETIQHIVDYNILYKVDCYYPEN